MRPEEFKSRRRSVGGSELSASMAAVIGNLLRKHGLGEDQADKIAIEAMGEMQHHYGGQQLYFSREERLEKNSLHEEIFSRFDTNEMSAADLASAYGFSLAWIYNILRQVRNARRAAREAQAGEATKRSQERWKREGANGDAV
jgi:Mor family transcriptional regulator